MTENLDATASEVVESNGRTALIITPVDGAKVTTVIPYISALFIIKSM